MKLPLNFYISSDVNIPKGKEELDNGDLSPLHRMRHMVWCFAFKV
ncbi:MAG: hypothetical protein R2777_04950 [Chitinophagales bacterium]